MLKKHSSSMPLLAQALALRALPLAFLWAAPRFLPEDQMGPSLQYWTAFNVVTLGCHGSVESMVPRILSRQQGVKKLVAISSFAALLSILSSTIYIHWIKVEIPPEVFIGIAITMILSVGHSAGGGGVCNLQ